MTNFIQNLIERHTQAAGNIKPRLPGRFEPDRISPMNLSSDIRVNSLKDSRGNEMEEQAPTQENNLKAYNQPSLVPKYPISKISSAMDFSKKFTGPLPNVINEKKPENTQSIPGKAGSKLVKGIDPFYEPVKADPEHSNERVEEIVTKSSQKNKLEKKTPFLRNLEESKSTTEKFAVKPQISVKQAKEINKVNHSADKKNQKQEPLALPEWFSAWMDKPSGKTKENRIQSETPEPIRINIGRIEVKAIMDSPVTAAPRKQAFKPKLTLEDYLKQRNGNKR